MGEEQVMRKELLPDYTWTIKVEGVGGDIISARLTIEGRLTGEAGRLRAAIQLPPSELSWSELVRSITAIAKGALERKGGIEDGPSVE